MNRAELTKRLTVLCTHRGISGDESDAAQTALGFLKAYCEDAYISHGNVVGTFGS
jgi:putative aminopeptidase FrvX